MSDHPHFKFPAEAADRLLSEERGRAMPPERVLAPLEVAASQTVADIGCGPGFFSLPLARMVGPDGVVLALDISPSMLERVGARAAAAGLDNVRPLASVESGFPLEDASCDRVLAAFLLHELADPAAFLREMHRVLRPAGRGLAVDWAAHPTAYGPPVEVRVSPAVAAEWLSAAGLTPGQEGSLGPDVWTLPFARP